MEITRKNFQFNRIIDIPAIINNLHVFYMEQTDINSDNNVHGELLEDGESFFVLQNIEEQVNNRYCYIKIKEKLGLDGITKAYIVKKIIIDNNVIEEELFNRMFTILLQQHDNTLTNRIIVPNRINHRFHNIIPNIANKISTYITWLYSTYTAPLVCPSYEVD